jgi:hypothetical protein
MPWHHRVKQRVYLLPQTPPWSSVSGQVYCLELEPWMLYDISRLCVSGRSRLYRGGRSRRVGDSYYTGSKEIVLVSRGTVMQVLGEFLSVRVEETVLRLTGLKLAVQSGRTKIDTSQYGGAHLRTIVRNWNQVVNYDALVWCDCFVIHIVLYAATRCYNLKKGRESSYMLTWRPDRFITFRLQGELDQSSCYNSCREKEWRGKYILKIPKNKPYFRMISKT